MTRLASMLALALALGAPDVRAEDAIVKGSIVKVEHQEIYVNLGSAQAVGDGATLRIKRTIRLRHPVTRATVEDWIPIGAATITEAGSALSRAVLGDLVTAVKLGDTVEVLVDRPDAPPAVPTPAPVPGPTPRPAAPAGDPVTTEVVAAFVAQTGQSLEARIATWERYLSTRPDSPYAGAIHADLATLHSLREEMRPPSDSGDDEVSAAVEHVPRTRVGAGTALPVTFVVGRPEQVASAYLHYRTRDHRTYSRILLVREHEIYLRGTVPAAAVAAPGLDYFVEVSTPAGRSGLALASPEQPIRVDVAPPPLTDRFGIAPGRTTVRLAAEALSFSTFDKREGDRRDGLYAFALDVGYRLDTSVQRVGVGYGAIGGVGGATDLTWDGVEIPSSAFHYGRADVDLGQRELAFGMSLIAGVGKRGFGLGFEGRARAGLAEATNVSILGRYLPEVGFVTDVRLGARPVANLLAGVSVGATDMPTQDELAARLGVDLEWIRFEHVSILARVSWQGRSTKHSGIGGGAALGFTW